MEGATTGAEPGKLSALVRAATGKATTTGLALTVIVLVGFTLRLIWVLHVEPVPYGDPGWYANVAKNVAEGRGFALNHNNPFFEPPDIPEPTAYYPPLYPLALATFWKVVGVSQTWAQVFNAVLSALTIVFVYALGHQIFDRRVGLLAAAAFALLPNDITWLPLLFSEPLFTLLFAAGLWALLVSRPWTAAPGPATALAFGLLAGLATLTRGEGLLLLAAAVSFWLQRDGRPAALRQFALALLATVAIIAPWTVRNWIELDTFVPISTNSSVNLRIGHAPDANGTFTWINDPIDGVPAWQSPHQLEWELQSYRGYTQRALQYAVTHPWREVQLAKDKVYYLYKSDSEMYPGLVNWGAPPLSPHGLENYLLPLVDATWYSLLFLTAATLPFWLRATPERTLLALVLLLWTVFHIVFFGLARFHLALLPVMTVIVAGSVTEAVVAGRGLVRRRRGT